ncbi:MAG: carbonic anhydrase [Flavobacteriales bacterium]|nr:carbonic anhydrase [Flavobacteriales bacterium]
MKNQKFFTTLLSVFFLAFIFVSCQQPAEKKKIKEITIVDGIEMPEIDPKKIEEILILQLQEKVHTKEEQRSLTPDYVLTSLKDGNKRFLDNRLTARNHSAQARNSALGQFPKAVILSCLDSRIPVEDVFDKGIGDLFVARVAGNFVNADILGSMEFGTKVAGAKLIVVMGHPTCGAVKASIDKVDLGNISSIVTAIRPAVDLSADFKGEKTSENKEYVSYVSRNNVLNTIEMIRKNSPLLKEMEDNNEIKIVGAYYEMETGKVSFL